MNTVYIKKLDQFMILFMLQVEPLGNQNFENEGKEKTFSGVFETVRSVVCNYIKLCVSLVKCKC